MITIEAKSKDGTLTDYQIGASMVLGAEASSPIPLPAAAGKGALRLVVSDEGGFSITDLNSLSGLFINGERVVRSGPLRVEDAIMVGGQHLRVKAIGLIHPPEPPKPTMHGAALGSAPLRAVETAKPSAPAQAAPPLQVPAAADAHAGFQSSERDREHQMALSQNAEFLHNELIKTLDLRRQDVTRMGDAELREVSSKLIEELIGKLTLPAVTDNAELTKFVLDEAVGLGVLESMLADDSVTEIMVNGAQDIFVERNGQTRRSPIAFSSEKAMMGVIERIVSPIGRRVDESSPLCDARLKDGSRVNIVIRPIALKGPSISIRKFAKNRLGVNDLVKFDSVDAAMVNFLKICVEQKKNIVISGGTGSGKTTLLNIISHLIPPFERIVTIEDAAELKLYHDNLVTLEARPANVEGRGQVTIRELVKNALRMRPDRIVVGECRGGEALDMLQAMNTGHDGSLSTLHANSPRDAMARLETLVLMAGMDLPLRAIREQGASAVDLIVQIARLRDGSRRITHVTEVLGMEGDTVVLQDVFTFNFAAGVDEHGKFLGQAKPTGVRPRFSERFADEGIHFDLANLADAGGW